MNKRLMSELSYVCQACPVIGESCEALKGGEFDDDSWEFCIKAMIGAGRIELAREFTRMISDGDLERDEIVDEYSMRPANIKMHCRALCSKQQMKRCHMSPTRSPSDRMVEPREYRDELGIMQKYASKKGPSGRDTARDGQRELVFSHINPDRYAEFISRNYRLAYHESGDYYLYVHHHWQLFKPKDMDKLLHDIFNIFETDRWSKRIESDYMSALRHICKHTDALKNPTNYINVRNGIIDISGDEVELIKHDHRIFSTVQLPVEYAPEAKCRAFRRFLKDVFTVDGNDKAAKELIMLVQEVMGYCLSQSTKAGKAFLLYGGGSNGKSVLINIMKALAGGDSNVSSVSLDELDKRFALSQIVGKTLNISTESSLRKLADTNNFKALATGDSVRIEEKHKNAYTYTPHIKMVFAMNSLPYVSDRSHGFERRLVIIPFDVKFVDSEPRKGTNELPMDKDIESKLLKELQGILTFALKGLMRLKKNDFKFTSSRRVNELTKQFKLNVDVFSEFVNDCITQDDNAPKIGMTQLKGTFRAWCLKTGHSASAEVSDRKFSAEIRRAIESEGMPFRKVKSSRYYLTGLRVLGLNDAPFRRPEPTQVSALDEFEDQ